jgi:hypothetical protein
MRRTMKKLIAFLLVCLMSVSAYAADVWKYKIKEITTPSLTAIMIRFQVYINDTDYVGDEVVVTPDELLGKTGAEKLAFIKSKIESKILPYKVTYNVSQGLKAYEGQEVIMQ